MKALPDCTLCTESLRLEGSVAWRKVFSGAMPNTSLIDCCVALEAVAVKAKIFLQGTCSRIKEPRRK